ncbi:hypothetical protein T4B_13034 [Trichinella pseudospiralis]|uniref:Uncharacterized protein n=1 Tax=Trichinella pseudospiralis TaxID=6337 RepID=A0A0V0XYC0_TRIPS|nr:hypothetical protein T4E_9706 [Trichinella pseudospiralis]KRY71327.1 hypothetical protein T4A_8131 [Trichinella pseudospiralis]KRZ30932.1 hypothetical protein T4B_13034 [Trichinella pseudospiralis]KRZ40178.1 hypothetical protein T4C_8338 [Trichinella pseudospiralis]
MCSRATFSGQPKRFLKISTACLCIIRCSDRDFFDRASRLSCQAGQEVSKLRRAVQITLWTLAANWEQNGGKSNAYPKNCSSLSSGSIPFPILDD